MELPFSKHKLYITFGLGLKLAFFLLICTTLNYMYNLFFKHFSSSFKVFQQQESACLD